MQVRRMKSIEVVRLIRSYSGMNEIYVLILSYSSGQIEIVNCESEEKARQALSTRVPYMKNQWVPLERI